MIYSIVMPVFNREDLTRNCLATLRPTLEGAGDGEIIIVDNGSSQATAAVLADFPWIKVIRNETNLGFAAACNQGARVASGRYIVHLNNDTIALDGWLSRMLARFDENDVGIVGARLLFPDDSIQHAGVVLSPTRLGAEAAGPYHYLWKHPGSTSAALQRSDFESVTGACLATPLALYLELGGFDEVFWNGYEDVDFCFRVRARGLRVVYEPRAVLYHYESQSGVQRKRRLMHNIRELAARWHKIVVPDHNRYAHLTQQIRRESFNYHRQGFNVLPLPRITLFVHGNEPRELVAFAKLLCAGSLAPNEVLWAADGPVPVGAVAVGKAIGTIANATERRSDRYVVFVDTAVGLQPDWLRELVDTVEYAGDIVAATVVPENDETEWAPLTADAQCTLVKMAAIPQHVRVDRTFATPSGAVADWMSRCVSIGRSVRRTHRLTARVNIVPTDPVFFERERMDIATAVRPNPLKLEELSRRSHEANRKLTSIVMLSWNAPDFTEMAVTSIKNHTSGPYEIIIIDNGSTQDTLSRLLQLTDVRLIYNATNMGFAYGCNQGMAAALGAHVVLLNNDVIVTDGWLEALLDAHSSELIGISAPRSNYVAGHQLCTDASYADLDEMHEYAQRRRERMRGRMYHTDRVIGFCMCISRSVIAEVGGINTRYKVGNFEDDDYCLRVRAAGYEIVVCEDSFIHHFGNVTFKANNVDWKSQMEINWRVFAERWQLPPDYPANGYDGRLSIMRGFDRNEHFVPLPALPAQPASQAAFDTHEVDRKHAIAILALVRDENDWSRVAPVLGNFARAVSAEDSVVFAIGAAGALDAATIGGRVRRMLSKAGIDPDSSADIDVSDVSNTLDWRERFASSRCLSLRRTPELPGLEPLPERSKSGIARTVEALVAL